MWSPSQLHKPESKSLTSNTLNIEYVSISTSNHTETPTVSGVGFDREKDMFKSSYVQDKKRVDTDTVVGQ